ncbi:MAG: hypothetical protein HKL82_01980 [Acidimicrobiaceae bacterium]|nr:hypothetical protein [Acidimicrobiaceae bacterium]
MVSSIIAALTGAIMYQTVTYQGAGIRTFAIGSTLVIIAATGFVVSSIARATSTEHWHSLHQAAGHRLANSLIHSTQ